jgi:hypothetical protein
MNSDPSSKRMITNKSSTSLAEALGYLEKEILSYLYLGGAKWDNLIKRIIAQEQAQTPNFADEQVWTFLIACGYALYGEDGIKRLTKILTGSDQTKRLHSGIWFEFMPLPPRKGERNTHIDLALGTISCRKQTKGGMQLDDSMNTWVCFCEMKYNSDIARTTTHDSQRNQLLRVIENALRFQSSDSRRYADKVYVTLVTPEVFRYANLKSRSYQYKYEEYKNDPTTIMGDLHNCSQQPNWRSTDTAKQINKFSLNWITYEELLANLPYTEETPHAGFLLELRRFWENYGRT